MAVVQTCVGRAWRRPVRSWSPALRRCAPEGERHPACARAPNRRWPDWCRLPVRAAPPPEGWRRQSGAARRAGERPTDFCRVIYMARRPPRGRADQAHSE